MQRLSLLHRKRAAKFSPPVFYAFFLSKIPYAAEEKLLILFTRHVL